jgi:hypothetical protein
MEPGVARPLALDGKPDATIAYDGKARTIRMR